MNTNEYKFEIKQIKTVRKSMTYGTKKLNKHVTKQKIEINDKM